MTDFLIVQDDGYMTEDTLSDYMPDGLDTDMDDMSLVGESDTDEDYEYEEPSTKEEMKELRHELKKELKALSPLTSVKWKKNLPDVPDFLPLDPVQPATFQLVGPDHAWVEVPPSPEAEPVVTLRVLNDAASSKLWRRHAVHGTHSSPTVAASAEDDDEDADLAIANFLPAIPWPSTRLLTHVHLDIGLAPEIPFRPVLAALLDQLKLGIFLAHLSIHLRPCPGTTRAAYIESLAADLRSWDHEDVLCQSVVELTSDFEDEAVKEAVAFSMGKTVLRDEAMKRS